MVETLIFKEDLYGFAKGDEARAVIGVNKLYYTVKIEGHGLMEFKNLRQIFQWFEVKSLKGTKDEPVTVPVIPAKENGVTDLQRFESFFESFGVKLSKFADMKDNELVTILSTNQCGSLPMAPDDISLALGYDMFAEFVFDSLTGKWKGVACYE